MTKKTSTSKPKSKRPFKVERQDTYYITQNPDEEAPLFGHTVISIKAADVQDLIHELQYLEPS